MSVFFGGKKKTNRKTKQNKTTLKPNCNKAVKWGAVSWRGGFQSGLITQPNKGAMPHWRPLQEHPHCMATGMATCNSLLSDSWPVLQQNSHFSPCPFCRASLSCWRHLLGSGSQSTAQQKAHVSKEPEREEAPCYPNVLRHHWTHRWTHTTAARTSYNLFIDFAYL